MPAHWPNGFVGHTSGCVLSTVASVATDNEVAAVVTAGGRIAIMSASAFFGFAGAHAGMHMPQAGPNVTQDVPSGQHESGCAPAVKLY